MTGARADQNKPWWRWPIYVLATLLVLFGTYWFAGLLVGVYMGWGGRSSFQIALLVLYVTSTAALTITLALKAIVAAQDREFRIALARILLSLLGAPLALILLNFQIVPL